MRLCLLTALIVLCHLDGIAGSDPTREETLKWLQKNVVQDRAVVGKAVIYQHAIPIFLNVNLVKPHGDLTDKDFTTSIESSVSWKKDEIDVQNDIFENGKLKESYTYQIPLAAILSAKVTNCPRNVSGNVNAYHDRPLFILVKKNSTKVGHISFAKSGKTATGSATQYHMNNKDGDWDSLIPLAINIDRDPEFLNQVLNTFARLVELNAAK